MSSKYGPKSKNLSAAAPSDNKWSETKAQNIKLQSGIVKAVPSGDSITILQVDDTKRDEYKEILFTFLGLKAPQLGRRTNEGKSLDEPFAWHSREFLRKLIIGQPVIYRLEHHDKASDRYYGELWDQKENDVRLMIVENGWSDVLVKRKVNNQGVELEPSISQQQLESALQEAKNKKKGIWNNHTDEAIRRMKYIELYRDPKTDLLTADDLFEFFKSHRNRKAPLNGIVESVKTGSQLNILLPDTMQQFPLVLTGIRCPGFNKENEPELFHKEAKFITEYYLLHRNVTITLDSIDKVNIYGTVLLDGETNVAFDLLRMGLANFVEWSVPKNNLVLIERLKDEEKDAQQNNRRLWRSFKPISAPGKKGEKATKERSVITGKVVEVVNAGVITVRVTNPNKTVDRIIPLSSIRPPRSFKVDEEPPKTGSGKSLTPEQEKAWKEGIEENKRENAHAAEAKEFLRNLLIGQKVRCVFDYLRSAIPKNQKEEKNPLPPRLFWSVYLNDKNVAIELVKQGLAKVSAHSEDENRSAEYQDLIVAEKDAISQNKGIHNPVFNKAGLRLNDLTPPPLVKEKDEEGEEGRAGKRKGILSKCRVFLGHLQRVNKVEAIVEYILTGSRYKLVIPSQSCVLLFNLQACIVERPVRTEITSAVKPDVSVFDKQYPPDCPGNNALHFARDHLLQRKVLISVTNLDNFGIFSGTLFVNNKDFGLTLIENGHAKLHRKSASKLPGFDALKKAEEAARKDLRGLWATYDFAAEEERKNQDRQTQRSEAKEFEITITDFRNGALFSYQIINSELNGLKELSDALQNEKWGKQEPYVPSVGDIVVAQFTSDDVWYRARVIADNKPKGSKATGEATQFEVKYIDYGNREVLGKDRIRKIPAMYIDSLPPQAHEGKLFGVKAPSLDSDFGRDSAEGFREFVWNKTLTAIEMQKDRSSGTSHLILKDEERTNINIEMVKSGLARAERGYGDEFVRVTLKEAQEEAHKKRNGMWQCGYYPDSDEDRELESNLLR